MIVIERLVNLAPALIVSYIRDGDEEGVVRIEWLYICTFFGPTLPPRSSGGLFLGKFPVKKTSWCERVVFP